MSKPTKAIQRAILKHKIGAMDKKSPQPSAAPPSQAALLQRPPPIQTSRYAALAAHALTIGVFTSVCAHTLLLALNFTLPSVKLSRQQDRGLEIVLVNARHKTKPKESQVLAQANLNGGGNTDQKVLTTSPLPPQTFTQEGDALLESHKRVQQLETTQRQLLAQARSPNKIQVNPNTLQGQPVPITEPNLNGLDLLDNARAIARQEAIVDKRLNDYAKRPRKRQITTNAAEYRFAQYVEDWRAKVERIGTLHYPASARGRLSGNLLVSIEIRSDGTLAKAEIVRSSGHKILDEAALRILQLASPFATFPEEISKDTDILVITRTWTFTSSDQVKTE